MSGDAPAVPPEEAGVTLTVTTFEVAGVHGELVTTALKEVADDNNGVWQEVAVAPGISTQEPVAFVCHCIAPVLPVRLIVENVPEQTVEGSAAAVPATEFGLTAMVTVLDVAEGHEPLVTTAL